MQILYYFTFIFFHSVIIAVESFNETINDVNSTDVTTQFSSTKSDTNDILTLLLMGDTQFHFPCEEDNVQCKLASKRPRAFFQLDNRLEFQPGTLVNETLRQGKESCIRIESRFANRVQRQALDLLISSLDQKPAALIINGDLTDFGHHHQLQEFRQFWYNNFSIPFLLGLGNHDYENNINDCALNFCAHTMLSWYAEYVKNRSLVADIERKTINFDVEFSGSLAYTERVCSSSGKTCAFVIQLNNAIDYSVSFSSVFVQWNLTSPMKYVHNELNLLKGTSLPILLNMHKCENIHIHKVKMMLTRWLAGIKTELESNKKMPRVGVFYAHMHQRHEVHLHCIQGIKVPFVYVGSVPNNRFSKFDFNGVNGTVTGYKARDSLLHNGEILEKLETIDLWGPCDSNEHYIFADHVTRKRWLHLRKSREQAMKVNS
uniref:Metallophos domain-containing protein n=2 Tax=Caenorhabditis japonica TaxID=281687 RepID=A0A8R1DV50_CAEJA